MVDVLGGRVVGPLESYARGFAAGLSRQDYTVSGASQHLCFVAHLSRWMLVCGRDVSALTPEVVDEYLAARRSAGYVNYRSVRATRPLLDYLEPLGVLPQLAPVALGPVDVLLERYRGYLILERGLTAATARGHVDSVRPFVAGRARQDGLDMAGLTASDVSRFVLDACQHRATGSAKLIVTALRSLLNFLHLSGEAAESLVNAVPSVAGWALSGLPKGLTPDEVRRLLASCDRRRATGRRDYAIMLISDGSTARFALGGLPCPELVGDLLVGLVELIDPHGTVDAAGSVNHYVQSILDMARKLAGHGFTGRVADLRRRHCWRSTGWPPPVHGRPAPGGFCRVSTRPAGSSTRRSSSSQRAGPTTRSAITVSCRPTVRLSGPG